MKPKFSYATQAEITADNPYKDRYVEKDGRWVLDIEGAAPVEKVAEFRDKNIQLNKELTDTKKLWDGFNKEEVEALILKKKEIEDAKVKTEGDFAQKLKERTDAMKADYDKKLADAEKKNAENEARLADVVIDKALIEEGNRLGLRPEAADFLTTVGRKSFKLENGTPVAYGPDGKQIFGTDAAPLKIADFVADIAKKNAFAFTGSTGSGSPGGAGGGGGGGGGGGINPFKPGPGFNRTEQGRLFQQDEAQARRLAAEAGVTL